MNEHEAKHGKEDLPQVSKETLESLTQELLTTPQDFIKTRSEQMGEQSPLLFNTILSQALIMHKFEGVKESTRYLRYPLLVYSCFDSEATKLGQSIKVSDKTVMETLLNFQNPEVVESIKKIREENPLLSEYLTRLNAGEVVDGAGDDQLHNIRTGYTAVYKSMAAQYKTTETVISAVSPIPERQSKTLPLVCNATVRNTLLELVLHDNFIENAIDDIYEVSPAMADRIYFSGSYDKTHQYEYRLFGTFTVSCFLKEYALQNKKFPTITDESIASQYKEVFDQYAIDPAGRSKAFHEHTAANLLELRTNNFNLYKGMDLLARSRQLNLTLMNAAILGTTHPYSSIRNQEEINELNEKFNY